MNPWLVVACPGSRADELARCLGSLQHPPERTVIVSNRHHDPHPNARILDDDEDFSLARLWNFGLHFAYANSGSPDWTFKHAPATEVAVFASDVVGHPESIAILAEQMRLAGCVMAGPVLDDRPGHAHVLDGPRTAHDRVPGACFMLAAEHRLLCDEAYRWWYGDDDLEMQARAVGPVGIFAGTGLALSQPDSPLDDEKQAWAVEDRARFVKKWGSGPW